jgi:hypothetical protein
MPHPYGLPMNQVGPHVARRLVSFLGSPRGPQGTGELGMEALRQSITDAGLHPITVIPDPSRGNANAWLLGLSNSIQGLVGEGTALSAPILNQDKSANTSLMTRDLEVRELGSILGSPDLTVYNPVFILERPIQTMPDEASTLIPNLAGHSVSFPVVFRGQDCAKVVICETPVVTVDGYDALGLNRFEFKQPDYPRRTILSRSV